MDYQEILSSSNVPEQDGKFEPSFAFSIHKCGSSMMYGMIKDVCRQAGIPSVSIPDLLFSYGILDSTWSTDPALVPAFNRNLLYFGFRYLPPILMNPESRVRSRRFVLLVRDPRDALVSQYFSFGRKAGSHARPKHNPEALEQRLAAIEEKPIDSYVLEMAPALASKLEAYRAALDFDLGLLRRYEDVYFDKETFLGEIFDHFGIAVPHHIIAAVARANDVRPAQEDDSKHIRKGTPGDHLEKLRPETIAKLNDTFRSVCSFYGYDL